MFDALETTGGKSEMTLVLIGTRAPAEPPSWWLDLLDAGSGHGTYVQSHGASADADGDVAGWDDWRTIRSAHPLIGKNPHLKPKIAAELEAAKLSDDARARFISYRLNVPMRPAAKMLFSVAQWRNVESRAVGVQDGEPIIGLDVGASRSWTAAVILWPSMRVDVRMVCPGIPGLAMREKADGCLLYTSPSPRD